MRERLSGALPGGITMKQAFQRLQRLARYVAFCLLVAAPAIAPAPALASPDGPNGINIGFDFNWYNDGETVTTPTPAGYSAAFINNNGTGLTTCLNSPLTSATVACDFTLGYEINSVPQTGPVPGGVYETWPTATGPCNSNPARSAPLTLWDCFNQNSFGQIFYAQSSGPLSGMTISMTCLNPAGGPLDGLFAVLYQVDAANKTVISPPLAQIPADLSSCPTLTSWTSHTFTSGDFAAVPLNFSNINLTAGTPYGVFFAGPLVPGTPPAGFVPPAPAPTLGEWAEIALGMALFMLGIWKIRRRMAA